MRQVNFKRTFLGGVCVGVLVAASIHVYRSNKRIYYEATTHGKLNGVSMAIPKKYQFFPVVYEGDDVWNPDWIKRNRNRVPTPDMNIQSFSLLFHLPDYAAFNSGNAESWHHKKNQYGFNDEWISVRVDWSGNGNKIDGVDWFKRFVERSKVVNSEFASHKWRYEIADKEIYGLQHDSLVNDSDNDAEAFTRLSSHQELYYDTDNWSAKIECERMSVPPFAVFSCAQMYVLPELNSIVTINYNPKNLGQWREVQKTVTDVIRKFEVINSKN